MRIAFSGSHVVGKSTLVERVAEVLPGYAVVDEPYRSLEEDGYEFAAEPSLEDFEAQLERGLRDFENASQDVLFDRCPVDILAYLMTHRDADAFQLDAWLARVVRAMAGLDLIVFVPIEDGVRVALSPAERRLRLAVEERLYEMLVEDSLDLEIEVLTVRGDVESRLHQVLRRVRGQRPTTAI